MKVAFRFIRVNFESNVGTFDNKRQKFVLNCWYDFGTRKFVFC